MVNYFPVIFTPVPLKVIPFHNKKFYLSPAPPPPTKVCDATKALRHWKWWQNWLYQTDVKERVGAQAVAQPAFVFWVGHEKLKKISTSWKKFQLPENKDGLIPFTHRRAAPPPSH